MSSASANTFIARWAAAGASERANSQPFLCELCDMLGVARPEPTRETGYAFEYDVTKHHPDGSHSSRVAGPSRFGASRCQTGKGCSSKSANREFTCSTFLLLLTLYRWTESVTCTGSSLFAGGYAYFKRHRKYSALLPFRLRQTDLNPRQECQNSDNRHRQLVWVYSSRRSMTI